MKLRSVTLDNIRRFTGKVRVGPLGDGLTLIAEPNEAGKSTMFDALHALFFAKYSSFAKDVASLQPHSGGKISVEADVEHDGAVWRIRKQWQRGAGGNAWIWRDGVLVHQDDAVETWLNSLVAGEAGGPGGLLWVRQGQVTLSVDGRYGTADRKGDDHEARRDLLTLISGAVDDVTGGERMDRALAQVKEELSALRTTRGPKAGGRWAIAVAEVEELMAEGAGLSKTVDNYRDALDEDRRLRNELAVLEDADTVTERRTAVERAERAFSEARSQVARLDAARARARLAQQDLETTRQARNDALSATAALDEATTAAKQAEEARQDAGSKLADTTDALAAARESLKSARDEERAASLLLRRVERQNAARAAREQRADLEQRLTEARAAEERRAAAAALVAQGPDEKVAKRIDELVHAVETARGVRAAGAPRLTIRYDAGASPISVAGSKLAPDSPRAIPDGARLDLPGIGTLSITVPGESGSVFAKAENALSEALAKAGYPTLSEFRGAVEARADATKEVDLTRQRRDALAPDGIDALAAALARLPAAEAEPDLPDWTTAEAAVDAAQAKVANLAEEEAEISASHMQARLAASRAEQAAETVAERLTEAKARVEALGDDGNAVSDARLAELEASAETLQRAADELARATPDIEALEATLRRTRGVAESAAKDIQKMRERRAELRAMIASEAEAGVEERLEEVREKLARARDDEARVSFEVETLSLLLDELERARKSARDTYFEPVVRELRPLLSELFSGDAEVVFCDETLLPQMLVRRGTEEAIDVLSGGTQEQIAFLVRLAFARLLARMGRHAPLILDDALVYSDDDRIARMFDALHRAADGLQIIVLSCRQRVFRELGAPTVRFEEIEAS